MRLDYLGSDDVRTVWLVMCPFLLILSGYGITSAVIVIKQRKAQMRIIITILSVQLSYHVLVTASFLESLVYYTTSYRLTSVAYCHVKYWAVHWLFLANSCLVAFISFLRLSVALRPLKNVLIRSGRIHFALLLNIVFPGALELPELLASLDAERDVTGALPGCPPKACQKFYDWKDLFLHCLLPAIFVLTSDVAMLVKRTAKSQTIAQYNARRASSPFVQLSTTATASAAPKIVPSSFDKEVTEFLKIKCHVYKLGVATATNTTSERSDSYLYEPSKSPRKVSFLSVTTVYSKNVVFTSPLSGSSILWRDSYDSNSGQSFFNLRKGYCRARCFRCLSNIPACCVYSNRSERDHVLGLLLQFSFLLGIFPWNVLPLTCSVENHRLLNAVFTGMFYASHLSSVSLITHTNHSCQISLERAFIHAYRKCLQVTHRGTAKRLSVT